MSRKRPKHTEKIKTLKKPRKEEIQKEIKEMFLWGLGFVDIKYNGEWGWKMFNDIDIIEKIIRTLGNYESMKWSDIEQKSHCGSIDMTKLSNKAQNRLNKLELDDNEKLFKLVINGKKRLWGIRDGNKFNVLWYDPNHKVYPVELRNT